MDQCHFQKKRQTKRKVKSTTNFFFFFFFFNYGKCRRRVFSFCFLFDGGRGEMMMMEEPLEFVCCICVVTCVRTFLIWKWTSSRRVVACPMSFHGKTVRHKNKQTKEDVLSKGTKIKQKTSNQVTSFNQIYQIRSMWGTFSGLFLS